MNMDDFIAFQTEMLKKQAIRKEEHVPLILCRHELKEKTPCIVLPAMQNCLDCAKEHVEEKEREGAKSV
jgi:hypothetical protein